MRKKIDETTPTACPVEPTVGSTGKCKIMDLFEELFFRS